MQPYQEKYIQNAKEISEVISFNRGIGSDFDSWYSERTRAVSRIAELKKENLVLLNDHLFPALDDLSAPLRKTSRNWSSSRALSSTGRLIWTVAYTSPFMRPFSPCTGQPRTGTA